MFCSSCFFKITTPKQFPPNSSTFKKNPQHYTDNSEHQNPANMRTMTFSCWEQRKQGSRCCCEQPLLYLAQEQKQQTCPLELLLAVAHFWGVFALVVFQLLGFLAPFPTVLPHPLRLKKWLWKEGGRDGFRALLLLSILFFLCLVLLQQQGTFLFFLKQSHSAWLQWYS